MKAIDQLPIVQDLITDDWPALRAAAIRAAAAIDPDNFTLDPVRPRGRPPLDGACGAGRRARRAARRDRAAAADDLLKDEDKRVVPHVLRSLVRLKAPEVETILYAHLKEADYVIRETAAELIGQTKPAGGLAALREAYARRPARRGLQRARGGRVGDGRVRRRTGAEGVRAALADKDWAVRVRAAELLTKLDPVRRSPVGDPAGAGLTDCAATTIRS